MKAALSLAHTVQQQSLQIQALLQEMARSRWTAHLLTKLAGAALPSDSSSSSKLNTSMTDTMETSMQQAEHQHDGYHGDLHAAS
jgi:hypothetical protein